MKNVKVRLSGEKDHTTYMFTPSPAVEAVFDWGRGGVGVKTRGRCEEEGGVKRRGRCEEKGGEEKGGGGVVQS